MPSSRKPKADLAAAQPLPDLALPSASPDGAAEARRAAFRRAHEMALTNLRDMTDEEDAAITADAEADPDARPFTDAEFARAKPGRPPLLRPKQPINLRLDADVVDALRATGAGWQTRANGMLRAALKLDAS